MWDAVFQCLDRYKDLEEHSRGHKVLISPQYGTPHEMEIFQMPPTGKGREPIIRLQQITQVMEVKVM